MCRSENRWTLRVTEWVPKEVKHSHGPQKMRKVAGASWNRLVQDRGNWKLLGEAFILQRTSEKAYDNVERNLDT